MDRLGAADDVIAVDEDEDEDDAGDDDDDDDDDDESDGLARSWSASKSPSRDLISVSTLICDIGMGLDVLSLLLSL